MLHFILEISRHLANKISLLFPTNPGPALKMYIPIQWNQCISFPVNLATDRLINMLTMLGISLLMSWPFILSSRYCAFPSFINYIPLWWHWKGSTSWGHLLHLDIIDTRNDTANKWMTKLINEWWTSEGLPPFHGWGTFWEAPWGQSTGRKPHTDVVAVPNWMPRLFSLLTPFSYQLC